MHYVEMSRVSESGNVLFIILIAVALYASLMYAVSNSTRNSNPAPGNERLDIIASQIEQYGALVQQAVTRMRVIEGCTENQISFVGAQLLDYTNTNSPINERCNVFSPQGGGVPVATRLPEEFRANTGIDGYTLSQVQIYAGYYLFITGNVAGTSAQDLVILVMVSGELCNHLNRRLNGVNAPTNFLDSRFNYENAGGSAFGTAGYNSTANNAASMTNHSGCGFRASRGYHNYYRAIIVR